MNCPNCQTDLFRVPYEGIQVLQCEQCKGHLLHRRRLDSVKRRREKSFEQLRAEAVADTAEAVADTDVDTSDKVPCPRCFRRMTKEFVKEPAALHIDVCEPCRLVWLDGGELARLQLAWEISPQGVEAAELQRRLAEMSDERRAAFEENVANLPPGDSTGLSGIGEGFVAAFLQARFGRRC